MEIISKDQVITILDDLVDGGEVNKDWHNTRQLTMTFTKGNCKASLSVDRRGQWWWTAYNDTALNGYGCTSFGYRIEDEGLSDMLDVIAYHSDQDKRPNDSEIMAWLDRENKKHAEAGLNASDDTAFWRAVDQAWRSPSKGIREAVVLEVRVDDSASLSDLKTGKPESEVDSIALNWIDEVLTESRERGLAACYRFIALLSSSVWHDISLTESINREIVKE